MKLIRVQKTPRGSMMSIQALYFLAIDTVIMSILACVRQGIIYACYFRGADRYMETLFHVLVITGAIWGASAYTFSHLNATILLFKSTAENDRTKRIWIPIYDVMFIIFPLVWLGAIIFQGLRIVLSEKKMFRAAKAVLPLLDSALANPSQITVQTLEQLLRLQDEIRRNAAIFVAQRKGLCILATVCSGIFTLAGTAGLWLIHYLKATMRNNTQLLYTPHNRRASMAVREQRKYALPGRGTPEEASPTGSPVPPRSEVPRASPQSQPSRVEQDIDALQKLLRNLQSFVPLCILLTLYFPVSLMILYIKGEEPGWRWEELRNDIFTWPWGIIMNIIFATLNFNTWTGRKRYVTQTTSSTGMRRVSEPAEQANQPPIARNVLNVQLECAYPPVLLKDSKGTPKTLDDATSGEQQQKQASLEKPRYPWE